jgi:Fe-S cluster assembly scaffold protein SufB
MSINHSLWSVDDLQKHGNIIPAGDTITIVEDAQSMGRVSGFEVTLQPGSTLQWFLAAAGWKKKIRRRWTFRLQEGACLELDGAFVGAGLEHLGIHLLIEHLGPRTTSHATFRGALWGHAHAELRENIHMFPEAEGADGRVDGHVLILSRQANANVVPNLEIEQRNVRASHGATIGRVSPEHLFYLATRGIDQSSAEQLIVDGFFHEIVKRFPADLQSQFSRFIPLYS